MLSGNEATNIGVQDFVAFLNMIVRFTNYIYTALGCCSSAKPSTDFLWSSFLLLDLYLYYISSLTSKNPIAIAIDTVVS